MPSTLASRMAFAVALLLGSACASNTEVVNAWKDPTLAPLVYVSKDAGLRRAAEDELAKRLGNAVPAYRVMSDSLLLDRNKAKA